MHVWHVYVSRLCDDDNDDDNDDVDDKRRGG